MAPRKVGFLHPGSKHSFKKAYSAFVRRLTDIVEEEGDVRIFDRWAASDASGQTLNEHAAELVVVNNIEAIVAAGGPPSALALQALTRPPNRRIPIVFTSVSNPGPPPDGLGLVNSLDNPDENLTGIAGLTSELDVTRLELLRELVTQPAQPTIGVLVNPRRINAELEYLKLETAKTALNLTLKRRDAVDLNEINTAFGQFKNVDRVDAVLVTADSLFNDHRIEVTKAARGVRTIYQWREFAEAGGLMSYGPNIIDAYELAAEYVGNILDGETPAKLPVLLPDRYELVINMKVANKENFRIPASLLSRATFVRRRRRTTLSMQLAAEAADRAE